MVSEKHREDIEKESKKILDDFGKSLKRIEVGEKGLKSGVGGFREEGSGSESSEEFRKKVFDNAPGTEGDFLIMEKKKW